MFPGAPAHLVPSGNTEEVSTPRIWLIRCGEGRPAIDACIANDVIAARLPITGDIIPLSRDEILSQVSTIEGRNDHQKLASEIYEFASEVDVEDMVLMPDKSRNRYLLGKITGKYEWTNSGPIPDMNHYRKVDWISYVNWDSIPLEFKSITNYQRTVLQMSNPEVDIAVYTALADPLTKPQLLATSSPSKKSTTPRPRRAATTRPPKPAPASQERLCTSCGLKKHIRQFSAGSDYCVDCE